MPALEPGEDSTDKEDPQSSLTWGWSPIVPKLVLGGLEMQMISRIQKTLNMGLKFGNFSEVPIIK